MPQHSRQVDAASYDNVPQQLNPHRSFDGQRAQLEARNSKVVARNPGAVQVRAMDQRTTLAAPRREC
jgi:hypothetical protein